MNKEEALARVEEALWQLNNIVARDRSATTGEWDTFELVSRKEYLLMEKKAIRYDRIAAGQFELRRCGEL